MKVLRKLVNPTTGALVVCGFSIIPPAFASSDVRNYENLQITSTNAPLDPQQSLYIRADSKLVYEFKNGEIETIPLTYRTLFQPGDRIGLGVAGVVENINNKPIPVSLPADKSGFAGHGPFYSMSPAGNVLFSSMNRLFLLTHYDSLKEGQDKNTRILDLWGKLPGTLEMVELQQQKDQQLAAVDIIKVSSSNIRGSWFPAGGSETPWGNILSSQIREPDARAHEYKPLEVANLYLDAPGRDAKNGGANAYEYGYRLEILLDANHQATIQKRVSMGRYSGSKILVMPDESTIYITDNGPGGAIFMFVSDKARDLSSGTLYAAQWTQHQDDYLGFGEIKWIKLGHATDKEIRGLIDSGIAFSHIFDSVDEKDYAANPKIYQGFRLVNTYEGFGGNNQPKAGAWLKPKAGMEQAAAFLESRRYAAYLGATANFTQLRSLAFDPEKNAIFMAIHEIAAPVGTTDSASNNNHKHLQTTRNTEDRRCGGIFKLDLSPFHKDQTEYTINSEYIAGTAQLLLTGQRNITLTESVQQNDRCDPERIANPADIYYAKELALLFISEDSPYRMNNFLWAYNIKTKSLTRILSAPVGAAISGLNLATINGQSYLTVNIQQPGTYQSIAPHHPDLRGFIRRHIDKKASVGYIGPFPMYHRSEAVSKSQATNNQSKP